MGSGYIPNNTVNNTRGKRTENSLLFKSGMAKVKYFENAPAKHILLNMYILYAALNIIELLANIPIKGNLSNIPYKDMNSPKKFKLRGTPQLLKVNKKNKIEKIGINCVIPL